jgi:hypothetical protein
MVGIIDGMRAFVAALLVAGAPVIALAQQTPAAPADPAVAAEPVQAMVPVPAERAVSGFVIDVRGSLAKFGQRPATAQELGVTAATLPGPGLGGAIGAHVYPLRLGRVALGVGGEILLARRARQPIDNAGEAEGPLLRSRFFSITPQVSLNFGRRDGWSYASAGLGTASYETWEDTGEMPDRRVRAINYGGGARWFTASHLAFTVDLRFYSVAEGPATAAAPAARPSHRLMVLSAGISVR